MTTPSASTRSLVLEPSSTGYVDECYDNRSDNVPGTPVHVAAGAVTSGIDAELAVAAAITGRVTDSAGTGIPNVFVQTNNVSPPHRSAAPMTSAATGSPACRPVR